jgi:hypothetical protein
VADADGLASAIPRAENAPLFDMGKSAAASRLLNKLSEHRIAGDWWTAKSC